jgi:hypothetical protein
MNQLHLITRFMDAGIYNYHVTWWRRACITAAYAVNWRLFDYALAKLAPYSLCD